MIVFLVPDFEPSVGGTTRQVGLQARAHAARGRQVAVVTRCVDRGWPRRERLGGLDVHRVGPPGRGRGRELLALLALALWLRRRRRRIGPVVAVQWPDVQLAAVLGGVLPRLLTVWAVRGEAELALAGGRSPGRRALTRLRRRLLERGRHVVLTPRMSAELEAAGVGEATVIPVPVDLRHFRPPSDAERDAARASLDVEPEAFVVVYVGHLEERKAVDRLVRALGLLRKRVPGARLLLVGGGRGRPDDTDETLHRLVDELDLESAVTFCGIQPDPRPQLWAADALVLPSVREGMPNSLLEAMGCGLPCVAPASAGGDEVLDAETGIVPPSNEPADLVGALERLAADPALRAELGHVARERVRRYGVEPIADAYERVFAELPRGGSG
jgi:glycosyltransferase involved in cell wall biosynthesis